MPERTTNWWLVGATGALVIVGLVGMILTCRQIEKQLNVMKEQNRAFQQISNQATRPLAVVTVEHSGFSWMLYRIGDVDTVDGKVEIDSRSLLEVPIGSDAYKAITRVNIGVDSIVFGIRNSGRTPLYVTGIVVAAVTAREWVNYYNKSPESLCSTAVLMDVFAHLETDYIILPDSMRHYKKQDVVRTMPPAEFKDCLDSQSTIPFYPYVYMQYKDPYDNTYDLLLIMMYPFEMRQVSNPEGADFAIYSVNRVIIEKFRWDVLCPTD